jgi:hypothetical protein
MARRAREGDRDRIGDSGLARHLAMLGNETVVERGLDLEVV